MGAFSSAAYWDTRYCRGGNSGAGSAGRLARFKAETVNRIVAEHGISSVIEFGCGDGRQLALANYPHYVGVDVSQEAIRLCSERFPDDPSKIFLPDQAEFGEGDLALSLDVIFNLIEDDVFHRYMTRLFSHARRLVVIYSSNHDAVTQDTHVRHRDFCAWVRRHAGDWRCVRHIPNPYPFDPINPTETSFADFYIFAKSTASDAAETSAATISASGQGWPVSRGKARFLLTPHVSSVDAINGFTGTGEAATLQFFDAVLPNCQRMIDVGAYVGAMSLYTANTVSEVHAIEASPTHQALLAENLRRNPDLAPRITLHPVALGIADGTAPLFRKAYADSGSSLFEHVERAGVIRGSKEADIPVRHAPSMLNEIGVDARTLIKIDIEGAEYDILPTLAAIFAENRPVLQVSFHPFNIVREDAYRTALARIAASVAAAQALATFPHVYVPAHDGAGWRRIDPADRLEFLGNYLLRPKSVPRVGTEQYGFVDAIGFSWEPLPALD
jgi:FkbM family methyltransferase